MLDLDPAFRPIRLVGGYPPLEDLGLVGDAATTALVGLDGSIRWMCVPSFDSELFCALLDHCTGGEFSVSPEGPLAEAEDLYATFCVKASPLGLLSEQIDPSTGELSGNFPQAFSHIGVIASGMTLERARGAAR